MCFPPLVIEHNVCRCFSWKHSKEPMTFKRSTRICFHAQNFLRTVYCGLLPTVVCLAVGGHRLVNQKKQTWCASVYLHAPRPYSRESDTALPLDKHECVRNKHPERRVVREEWLFILQLISNHTSHLHSSWYVSTVQQSQGSTLTANVATLYFD